MLHHNHTKTNAIKISDSKHVTLTYELNVGEGDERELMEQATPEKPLEFIFGTNSMLLYPVRSATTNNYHNDMANASPLASISNLGGFGEALLSTVKESDSSEDQADSTNCANSSFSR